MPNQKSLLQTAEVRVANRLRQLRIDKGLTLSELATSAGLSQAFLSRIENHLPSFPNSIWKRGNFAPRPISKYL